MRKLLYLIILSCFAFVPWQSSAQFISLSTPSTWNNGQAGVTFEVIAARTVTVKTIWASLDPGTHNMEIYSRPGGDIGSFTGWTLEGSATVSVTSSASYAELPISLNVRVPAGTSMGFFVVSSNTTGLNYTTATGGQAAWQTSDQNITIDAYGWGGTYNMTSTFSPRSFNGRVDYVLDGAFNDIGVVSIDSVQTACPGPQDIWATIGNFGSNQVAFSTVNWTWNGVAQTPISISTLLDTFGGAGPNTLPVFLGTRAFTAGNINTILVSTSAPNGGVDTVGFNDNLTDQLAASLQGIFTINQGLPSGGSNFNSIQDAMSAVGTFGLCGPTEFHMAEGAYIGQFTLGSIPGGSATNTLTIKPNPSNQGNTIIAYNATSSADQHIVRFQGASYITLEGLQFRPLGTTYQRSIDFYGSNDHITIKNCQFENTATSTSTNFSHIYNQSGTANLTEHCTIEGNTFIGGSYAVYWYGGNSTSIKEDGNKFINNTISDYYYMGLAWAYQINGVVDGNDIEAKTSGNYSTNYGLYHYYSDFGTVTNNRIVTAGTSTNYGMYVYYNDGSSIDKVVVANNMISCLDNSGTVYGIYVYNNTHANLYHNTVHVNKGSVSSSARPLYAYGSSSIYGPVEIINNSFSNVGGGYAAYIYNRYSYISAMQNNNFYTSGSTFGYYYSPSPGTTTQSTWAAWQATVGALGANSVSVAPLFANDRDLHTITPGLDSKGVVGTGITVDIDGDVRCPGGGCPGAKGAPDIGADEFDPPQVDASAIDASLPCPGLVDVYVTVQNLAISPLNTVRVICTVNGSPTSGSGLVYNVGGLAPGATAVVNVGQFNFTSGTNYTILASTADPNGIPDPNTSNDQASVSGFPSLGGTFTVGGSNPDFQSLGDAIDAMNNSGICGPVTILVREGVYNEQLYFGAIPGTSATNTITIKPDPANTQAVEVAYTATNSTNPHVIRFEGASHITLQDMMISPTGTSYQRGIDFYGNNDHITLDGLSIQNNPTSTSTSYSLIYNLSGTANMTQNTTIQNCTLDGGSYAVYWYGGSSAQANMEDGNQFLNNTLTNYYYMGLLWYYQKNSTIDGNRIMARESGNYSTNYGIYSYYSDFGQITNNQVVAAGTSTNYGMYIYYNDASSSNYKLVANNMISCLDNTGTTYGMYVYNNTYVNYYHNSVLVNKGSASATGSARGAYIYGSSSIYGPINWVNNSVANLGGGPAVYLYNRYNYIDNMDNNNWYASGSNLGYYYQPGCCGGYRNSLATWQNATGALDQNSISVNPSYDGERDLHLSNIQMDGAGGTGTGITTDIDGDTRCPGPGCPGGLGAPDIGADEYDVPPIDLGISGLVNPVNGLGCDYRAFEPVVVTITNYGSEAVNLALNPALITVNVTGASTQSVSITIPFGSISVGGSLSWPVGVINLAIGGTHIITANVAVAGDGKARNDSRAFEIDVELVDQFPYNENFDNMATCSGSSTGTCDLSNGWSNDTGDDFDWHVDANGTSSSSTGPARDVSGSGNYLYAETSSPNFNRVAIANMPCVNIGGMTCPVLSFAYHMYGQTMGKMEVEVFDGQTWNNVYTLAGQQQTSSAAPWEYAQIELANFVNIGIIKIRFKCTSGSSFYSDMAIDDVSLLDLATDFQLDAVASTNVATTCDIVDFSGNSNVGLLVQKWDIVGGIQGRDWDLIQGTVRDRNVSIAFLKAGTYQVSFTGGALCGQSRKDTETIVVTQGSPNVDFTANSTTGQIGLDVFTLTDLTSPDATDWTWRILPGTEGVDYVFSSGNRNSQNPSVIFLRPGRYSVRLTAGTFCGASGEFKRDYFNISSLRPAAVGISNSEERLGEADHLSIHDMNILSVSPNPFSNYLQVNFVSLSEEMTEMRLSNMIGQTVHTEVIEDIKAGLQEVKLNLPENLSAGVYTLTVRQGTRTKTMKVIKE